MEEPGRFTLSAFIHKAPKIIRKVLVVIAHFLRKS